MKAACDHILGWGDTSPAGSWDESFEDIRVSTPATKDLPDCDNRFCPVCGAGVAKLVAAKNAECAALREDARVKAEALRPALLAAARKEAEEAKQQERRRRAAMPLALRRFSDRYRQTLTACIQQT